MTVSRQSDVDRSTTDGQRPVLVLTRPTARVGTTLQAMNEAGVVCLHMPVIDIVPVERLNSIDLAGVDLVVFVSPAAVEHGLATLQTQVSGKPVVAVGSGTANALANHGIKAQAPQSGMRSEDLLSIDTVRNLPTSSQVLIVKGEGGRTYLSDALTAQGHRVVAFDVYRREHQPVDTSGLDAVLAASLPVSILLTSEDALDALKRCLSARSWKLLTEHARPIVYSERLALVARKHGFVNPGTQVSPGDLGELTRLMLGKRTI